MNVISINITKRVELRLLELPREAMTHPLYLAISSAKQPDVPQGMSHDQAIKVPGDYQDSYQAYEAKAQSYNNAALLGWAADIRNINNFADDIQNGYSLDGLENLYEQYCKEYSAQFTGNETIDLGLKISSVALEISKIDSTLIVGIRKWLSATYQKFGLIDSEKVDEAVKSESGDTQRTERPRRGRRSKKDARQP